MADLEAVLADVSYLMAMEKSKCTPAARASRKIVLPDPSVRSVMHKYMEKMGKVNFDEIFNQRIGAVSADKHDLVQVVLFIGFLLFKEYCTQVTECPISQLQFYEKIQEFTRLDSDEERITLGKEIYDNFIMKELVSRSHTYSKETVDKVQEALTHAQKSRKLVPHIFEPYIKEICDSLRGAIFDSFIESEKYTRFCQWKNLELNMQLTMNDFSVHRIIGRGGFGEVYGCRKADTGKMYAMKCLDKKRIKMKGGESLALNERVMLSLVSTGTPEKLCFILDLMNGGDLHYHLSQNGLYTETQVRFYAAEIILGLEHMHNRNIVYRDLKPANILLDENGHVRISDLGLAHDFSKKKPHASVGTHGYMAPEVLAKGQAYDSSADWFSFGCMLYKLLKGHSPFRHHKTKDRHEIDRMTMTADVELPDSFSDEMKSLLKGLLKREVEERLGCQGRGAAEVKEHPFFDGTDWQLVYLQKYPPPIIPPRGEVNAADAFDIGSFDEDDTKGIKLSDDDQALYKDFNMVVSERWQSEVCETVFDTVNLDADKRRPKVVDEESNSDTDCIVEGEVSKLGGPFMQNWQKKHLKLYPNRLEFYSKKGNGTINRDQVELISMLDIKEILPDFQKLNKTDNCIIIHLKNDSKIAVTSPDRILINQWKDEILHGFQMSTQIMATMNKKASKMYGASIENKRHPIDNTNNSYS